MGRQNAILPQVVFQHSNGSGPLTLHPSRIFTPCYRGTVVPIPQPDRGPSAHTSAAARPDPGAGISGRVCTFAPLTPRPRVLPPECGAWRWVANQGSPPPRSFGPDGHLPRAFYTRVNTCGPEPSKRKVYRKPKPLPEAELVSTCHTQKLRPQRRF